MANDAFSGSLASTDVRDAPSPAVAKQLRIHPLYWFDDGSLIIQAGSDAYKVHATILNRLSSTFAALPRTIDSAEPNGVHVVQIPDTLGVLARDMEALLGHIYHDKPLDCETNSSRLASILRVTSRDQLNFQSIHQLTRNRLERVFNTTLDKLVHPDHPEELLKLAVNYNIPSIQKALYYSVATTVHFDTDSSEDTTSTTAQIIPANRLSPELIQRCKDLLDHIISHFTPILFTVATANDMACTDVFAEAWMPLVIQPALMNSGLLRPIETLQEIINLDWRSHGLCESCVEDKREEWRKEQFNVWTKLDNWIELEMNK